MPDNNVQQRDDIFQNVATLFPNSPSFEEGQCEDEYPIIVLN